MAKVVCSAIGGLSSEDNMSMMALAELCTQRAGDKATLIDKISKGEVSVYLPYTFSEVKPKNAHNIRISELNKNQFITANCIYDYLKQRFAIAGPKLCAIQFLVTS